MPALVAFARVFGKREKGKEEQEGFCRQAAKHSDRLCAMETTLLGRRGKQRASPKRAGEVQNLSLLSRCVCVCVCASVSVSVPETEQAIFIAKSFVNS